MYQVIISSPNSIRETSEKPVKVSDNLRQFGAELVHVENVVYTDNEGNSILAGPVSFALMATKVVEAGEGKVNLVLASGGKATLQRSSLLSVTITEVGAADEAEEDTPAPKAKGKKAAPVEEEDDEEDTPAPKAKAKGKKAAPVDDEDDEDDTPAPKAKAAKGKKAAPVFEEDDEEEDEPALKAKGKATKGKPVFDDEDDEDDTPAPKAKGKKAAVVEEDDDMDFDEEDEPAPKAKAAKGKKAAPVDDDEEEDLPAPKSAKGKKAAPVEDDFDDMDF